MYRLGLIAALLIIAPDILCGQSVSDPIDDPLDCATGEEINGLLPGVIDIISLDIRKQNDDLVANVEFRGDPSIGDSVSGGILVFDPEGLPPQGGSPWHFDNAGNLMFNYAGDALATDPKKYVTDSTGAWVADTTTGFDATRSGNVVIVTIPGSELGPGSVWMAYSSSRLFEITPRCDASGSDNDGLPILEVPQLVASPDTFLAAGNETISVPAGNGLLVNDIDASSIIDSDETSEAGGNVAVDPSGSFQYISSPGFAGIDRFSYTVTDGKGGSSTTEVVVEVGPALWYVDATAEASGTGNAAAPFPDLLELSAVMGEAAGPKAGDAIVILGQGTYQSRLTLEPEQIVVGEGVDVLSTLQAAGLQIPLFSEILSNPPPQGGGATLASDSTDAMVLAQDNSVYGLSFGDTPLGFAMRGDSVGTLVVSSVIINGRGGLVDASKGIVDLGFDAASSDSSNADAFRLKSVSGTVRIEQPLTIDAPGRDGLHIDNSSVSIVLDDVDITRADSGAAIFIGSSENTSIEMAAVHIESASGRGVYVSGGGTLAIDSGTVRVGGAAIDADSLVVAVSLDTLASQGSAEHGLRLVDTSGQLTVTGEATIDSTGSTGIEVSSSSVSLDFSRLSIGRADSSYAVRIVDSPGSALRVNALELLNEHGGGLIVRQVDSLRIDGGSIISNGGSALVLAALAADVTLESISVDSANSGIAIEDIGGNVRLGQEGEPGDSGVISNLVGRAVEAVNVSSLAMRGFVIEDVASTAISLRNFGDARFVDLEIVRIDSTAIQASAGNLLEIEATTVSDSYTGIEAYEVGEVRLTANVLTGTDSTAIVVSNAPADTSLSKQTPVTAGDIEVLLERNSVLSSASDAVSVVAAESGALVLDLRENAAVASETDYALTVVEPAMLLLAGFAGGDADDVTEFVRRTNDGAPRVRVTGVVSAGPTGAADVVLVEKTVSDPEPLPERLIEYRILVANRGPSPAIQVVVSDSLPDPLPYVPTTITVDGVLLTDQDDGDAADFGVTTPGTVTARLGDLSAGDTVLVTLSARPRQEDAGAQITNTALVRAMNPDDDDSNNAAEVAITIKLNTAIETEGIPDVFALFQNYPNPFNPTTTIAFDLPQREFVRLTVVNILGQPVAELVSSYLDAGHYDLVWDPVRSSGSSSVSGLYFYRLEAGPYVATRSMILVK